MSEFRVWAPNAQRIQVRLANYIHEMESLPGGWWLANAPEAPVGADYSFIVDGGDPLPDPRSPWQPYGVRGPSRLLDHSLFPWSDGRWQAAPLSSAIVYELHIGAAGGAPRLALPRISSNSRPGRRSCPGRAQRSPHEPGPAQNRSRAGAVRPFHPHAFSG